MDSSDVLSIIIILILIGLSAFFSASETAASSASRVRMKSYADDGDKRAKRSLSLIENFDKTLSSILVGNNIVNIASTSIATALFLKLFPQYGALLSTVMMPTGMPVATVAVNGAANAALLAIQMLAIEDKELEAKLSDARKQGSAKVLEKNRAIEEKYNWSVEEKKIVKLYQGM